MSKDLLNIEHCLLAIDLLKQQTEMSRHRRLLVLSGSRAWANKIALAAISRLGVSSALWLTDQLEDQEMSLVIEYSTAKKAVRHLGSERKLIVMDAYAGFHPDGFGAISGTLVAGGLFILITPEANGWSDYDDPDYERITSLPFARADLSRRFISRINKAIDSSGKVLRLCERVTPSYEALNEPANVAQAQLQEAQTKKQAFETALLDGCITEDQQRAVDAICKVVTGHRRRPLVITSDRGRGKSAALGLAAAKLINRGIRRIVLTAPFIESVESAFTMLEAQFPHGVRHDFSFTTQQSVDHEVTFMAPDELIAASPDADLVLVDEAAAIPAPMLESFLLRYSRIVFASTIHGYEGTGRGFAVRFTKVLDRQTPQWNSLHLKSPIRWADNDPLETFVFDALLLNTSLSDTVDTSQVDPSQRLIKWLDQNTLSQNESLLKQVFGLLVLAHYRTSPDDLRMLLDGPSLRVAALFDRSDIVAVALVLREGGLDRSLGDAIWQGRRRPRGHLIPQVLSSFSGFREATDLKGDRVMRIAVHPKLHHLGLGTALIEEVYKNSLNEGVDYLGASFGATPNLLDFWQRAGFYPVRLGLQREASSGEHSVVVIKPISDRAAVLVSEAVQRFNTQLYFDLSDHFNQLNVGIITRLLCSMDPSMWVLGGRDIEDLNAFTVHQRVYESCSHVVAKCVMSSLLNGEIRETCTTQEVNVLLRRVIQKNNSEAVINELKLKGKKELDEILRSATRKLYRP
ncbi:tRNA(Met) cytidine acetyltransferase TmcA [Alkalimarinus alittae]|uniref:tRNA(Met) cytidine acetyltransferase TmcA n=1 Tax=Alkalimarinus alittae TaxID=2961619 RepID=A0ABY6N0N3_9ALTE|nr:GNAT family N-acetyltransferase [Alkalimarinus alittae]UZE95661.1 GNAT family N-acetyltransferase [Alkalimarinus alittae]